MNHSVSSFSGLLCGTSTVVRTPDLFTPGRQGLVFQTCSPQGDRVWFSENQWERLGTDVHYIYIIILYGQKCLPYCSLLENNLFAV